MLPPVSYSRFALVEQISMLDPRDGSTVLFTRGQDKPADSTGTMQITVTLRD